jgi:pimeloyl-ACP methyl ester carboxylesterase
MEKTQSKATLNDGSTIDIEVQGKGPALLISVNPVPIEGAQADEMRKWGVDPALGRSLIDGLCNTFRVVAFDYEGHLMKTPQPDTLTPDHIANDLLAVADAANARQFAYYGYSWLALCGMQLAIRTDRLTALIMGGFPPIGGPYKEMLTVTQATHEMASAPKEPANTRPSSTDEFDWNSIEVTLTEGQTRQFVTLYQALQDFDDRAAQGKITCPRLCFAGSADKIVYGERWKNAVVGMAAPLIEQKAEIEALGWEVRVLDGLDHTGAMQAGAVLPVILPWLNSRLNS